MSGTSGVVLLWDSVPWLDEAALSLSLCVCVCAWG